MAISTPPRAFRTLPGSHRAAFASSLRVVDRREASATQLGYVSETDDSQQQQIDALTAKVPAPASAWRVEGYAGVFTVLSAPLKDMFGEYFVRILPGAFDQVLAGGCDTRFLFNHDPNYVLARTTNATLTLTTDQHGLAFTADPADVSYAADLRALLDRGDLTQCSFAFGVNEDAWIIETASDGTETEIWEIRQFSDLDDVAVVTYPAFPQTTARVREVSKPAGDHLAASTRRRLTIAAAQTHRRTA